MIKRIKLWWRARDKAAVVAVPKIPAATFYAAMSAEEKQSFDRLIDHLKTSGVSVRHLHAGESIDETPEVGDTPIRL